MGFGFYASQRTHVASLGESVANLILNALGSKSAAQVPVLEVVEIYAEIIRAGGSSFATSYAVRACPQARTLARGVPIMEDTGIRFWQLFGIYRDCKATFNGSKLFRELKNKRTSRLEVQVLLLPRDIFPVSRQLATPLGIRMVVRFCFRVRRFFCSH